MRLGIISNGFHLARSADKPAAKDRSTSGWAAWQYFAGPLALTAVWGLSFALVWNRLIP